jgi:ubiquinol-cytochrome c reductase cytochrome b subunit
MANDAIFGLVCGVVVIVLAFIYGGAPLGHQVNPANIQTNPRPFWFLIWYYAFLALIPPDIEDILIIAVPGVIMTWMLLLPFYAGKGQRAASKRPWAVASVFVAVLSFMVLVHEGYVSPWAPHFTKSGQLITVPQSVIHNLPNAEAKQGAVLFGSHACTACHSVAGIGGVRGPAVETMWRDFQDDPQMLYAQILVGGKGMGYQAMPGFGKILNTTQVHDLVQFIKYAPHSERGVTPLGNDDPGRWTVVGILLALLFVLMWFWIGRIYKKRPAAGSE